MNKILAFATLIVASIFVVLSIVYSLSLTGNREIGPLKINVDNTPTDQIPDTAKAPTVKDEWVRKEYKSDGQVVWNITQPVKTTANDGGLMEGALELNSEWKSTTVKSNFYFPIFDNGFPKDIDEWAKLYLQPDSAYYDYTKAKVVKTSKNGVEIRIITGAKAFMDGDKDATDYYHSVILIWSHQSMAKENVNPSVISITQPAKGTDYTLEFAQQMVSGLKF